MLLKLGGRRCLRLQSASAVAPSGAVARQNPGSVIGFEIDHDIAKQSIWWHNVAYRTPMLLPLQAGVIGVLITDKKAD